MKLESLVAAIFCGMMAGGCPQITNTIVHVPPEICNQSPFGSYKSQQILSGSRDNTSLSLDFYWTVDNFFDNSNPKLRKELLDNVTVYKESKRWGGLYINSDISDCSRDVILIDPNSFYIPTLIHELLHDVWNQYFNDVERADFLKVSKAYYKGMFPGSKQSSTKSDLALEKRDDHLDSMIINKLEYYLVNYYKSSVHNPDPENIDFFFGTEVYAYLGELIVAGGSVPSQFLPFYRKIIHPDILGEIKK